MSELWDVEELVIQAQQGEEAAFVQLMKKYERLVYYIAIQKMGNEADAMDVVQETFIEVRKSIHNLKEPRFFKAWLNRIVFSKVARYYEKRKDRVMDDSELCNVHKLQEKRIYMNPEHHARYQVNKDILHQCISKLKPIYQDVLILQYFEEFSMAEIAETLNIPEGTVKSRLNVAKKELRSILEELEISEGVQLNFNSIGIEAFLLGAFAKSYEGIVATSTIPIVKAKRIQTKFQAHPFLAPVVSIGVLAGSVAGVWGGYSIYQSLQEPTIPAEHMNDQTAEHKIEAFPPVIYQGESISTARMAYQILYDAAFKDQTRNKEELKRVYDTLKNYGGSYASMADYIIDDIEL